MRHEHQRRCVFVVTEHLKKLQEMFARGGIKSGAWLPTDVTPDVVFETSPGELWARAYQRIGTSPMAFTTRTVGSA